MPTTYHDVYARWRSAPEAFWAEAAEAVHWYRRWDAVLDTSRAPFYRWFPGGEVNTCYNALDRHVENGRADQVALIYDSPVTVDGARLHLPRAAGRGGPVRGRAGPAGREPRRPGRHLHADGARGGHRACWPAPGSARSTRSCSAGSPRPSWPAGSRMRGRR